MSLFPRSTRARRGAVVALTVAALGASAAATNAASFQDRTQSKTHRYVPVQLLGINDFHGNLEPPTGSGGRAPNDAGVVSPAGGAAFLATHFKRIQADRIGAYSVGVASGDLIGASPLVSAVFKDEPTIEFLNQLGLFASATGNHEYDEGITELQRMQNGGCSTTEGCFGGDGFVGARFSYLSANVTDVNGKLVMPAYAVRTLEPKIKIGFIGLPLKDTPSIVTAAGVAGLTFGDEVEATDKAVAKLQELGVESIVLLVHQGDSVTPGALPNDCGVVPGGPARTIAEKVSPAVDAVFSGHSHQAFNCIVTDPAGGKRPFVQGGSFGRYLTEVNVVVDRTTGDIVRYHTTAYNHLVTRDVKPDFAAQKLVEKYQKLSAPIANRKVADITADIGRAPSPAGEQPLGDVIADAQLASTDGPSEGGAVAAFMNPGGIRADLTFASSPAGEGDGVVTYAEAFTVQPFTNFLTTLTLTGTQIDTMLEQQFDNPIPGGQRFLQVSAGFSYAWSQSAPVGSKVNPASITINGTVVDPAANYRITVNNFLAGGGDKFPVLAQGTDQLVGAIDIDSFVDYATATGTIAPPPATRITVVP